MSVQVRSAALRETPSFLGRVRASVAYGDRVDVVAARGDWYEVRLDAARAGWLHASALTEKKVVLKAGAADVEAATSGKEVALAGKGFNRQVEESYRAKHGNLDFGLVDRMERIVVTPQEIAVFLKEGGVHPPTGGIDD